MTQRADRSLSQEPLSMTVHSLPSPGAAEADAEQKTVRGRWKMLAVLLVCAAPVVASYFTYYVVRPDSRRSYGELIAEQPALPDVTATDLAGKPVRLPALRGQWLLVSVAGGACDGACERHLYLQRQLREGLGKEKERLDWLWIVSDDAPVPDALTPALRQATVLRMRADDLTRWLQAAGGHTLSEHLYVVDPMGHWMMRFPPALDAGTAPQAKRDLERLLRAAASWDEPGR